MTQLEAARPPKKKTAMERKAVHGREGVDRALPLTPTGLADGLGLGSVLWRTGRQYAPMIGSPAFRVWRENFGWR